MAEVICSNKRLILENVTITSNDSEQYPWSTYINDHTILIPKDYPFMSPLVKTDDLIFDKQFNTKLKDTWSPQIKIVDIADMIDAAKIKANTIKNIKREIIQNNYKDLQYIKNKYTTAFEHGNYPEFEKKMSGIWINELDIAYLIFYVKGIHLFFVYEPKVGHESTMIYESYYACSYHVNNDNVFNLHVDDGRFNVYTGDSSIEIIFFGINDKLDALFAMSEINYNIGNSIMFTKI